MLRMTIPFTINTGKAITATVWITLSITLSIKIKHIQYVQETIFSSLEYEDPVASVESRPVTNASKAAVLPLPSTPPLEPASVEIQLEINSSKNASASTASNSSSGNL